MNENSQIQFNYRLEIDGLIVGYFSECIGINADSYPNNWGNDSAKRVNRKLPEKSAFSKITLKRGITSGVKLLNWINSVQKGANDKKDGTIILFNETREPICEWRFKHGWPSKFLSSGSRNQSSGITGIEFLELTVEKKNLSNKDI